MAMIKINLHALLTINVVQTESVTTRSQVAGHVRENMSVLGAEKTRTKVRSIRSPSAPAKQLLANDS